LIRCSSRPGLRPVQQPPANQWDFVRFDQEQRLDLVGVVERTVKRRTAEIRKLWSQKGGA
jgi:hypothetical protein